MTSNIRDARNCRRISIVCFVLAALCAIGAATCVAFGLALQGAIVLLAGVSATVSGLSLRRSAAIFKACAAREEAREWAREMTQTFTASALRVQNVHDLARLNYSALVTLRGLDGRAAPIRYEGHRDIDTRGFMRAEVSITKKAGLGSLGDLVPISRSLPIECIGDVTNEAIDVVVRTLISEIEG